MMARHGMLAGLGSFVIFQGIRTSIAKIYIIFYVFQGWGSGPPVPPLLRGFGKNISDYKNKQTYPEYEELMWPKIVSEYDQEIPQSQTADNPVAPQVRRTCRKLFPSF